MSGWQETPGTGIALYDFAAGQKNQIALTKDDTVIVEQCKAGWYKGYVKSNPTNKGIFPMTYVEFVPSDAPPVPEFDVSQSNPASSSTTEESKMESKEGSVSKPAAVQAASVSVPVEASPAAASGFSNLASDTAKPALEPQKSESVKAPQAEEEKVVSPAWSPKALTDTRNEKDGILIVQSRAGDAADASNTNVVELLNSYRALDSSASDQGASAAMPLSQSSLGALEPAPFVRLGSLGKLKSMQSLRSSDAVEVPAGPKTKLQLFLEVKVCIFSVGEATELFFSLFSGSQNAFITEDYIVNLPPPGMPEHTKILGRMKTVFTDLDHKDMQGDIWLVCRIFRKGSLQYDPKEVAKLNGKAAPGPTSRRCFGCAVTNLSQAGLLNTIGKEYEPPPANLTIYTAQTETNFFKIHEMLMAKNKDKDLEPAPRAKGIALGLTLYEGDLAALRADKREGKRLREASCETHKLDFPDSWNPSDQRNDLYVLLLDGSFSQGKKTAPLNVEVRVKVVRSDYSEVKNALMRGAGEDPTTVYATGVYYHSNTPYFNEIIKVRVPPNVLEDSHLHLEFWHVSNNPKKSACYATAYFPLVEGGAVATSKDTAHSIVTYNPFEPKDAYLTDATKRKLRPKEFFKVRTFLTSTCLTQNPTLAALSRWKVPSQLANVRNALTQFQGKAAPSTPDLARYMREMFDHLFGILGSSSHSELHSDAHAALLIALSRFGKDHKPMVDQYVKANFSDALAHQRLVAYAAVAVQEQLEAMIQTITTPSSNAVAAAAPLTPHNMPSSPSANSASSASVAAFAAAALIPVANLDELLLLQEKARRVSQSLFAFAKPGSAAAAPGGASSTAPTSAKLAVSTTSDSGEDGAALARLARSLRVVVQIAVQSFMLDERRPSPSTSRDQFRSQLSGLLFIINGFLQLDASESERFKFIGPIQHVLLRAIGGVLSELRPLFSDTELAEKVLDTIIAFKINPATSVERLSFVRSVCAPFAEDPALSSLSAAPGLSRAQLDKVAVRFVDIVAEHMELGLKAQNLSEAYVGIAILKAILLRVLEGEKNATLPSTLTVRDLFRVVRPLIDTVYGIQMMLSNADSPPPSAASSANSDSIPMFGGQNSVGSFPSLPPLTGMSLPNDRALQAARVDIPVDGVVLLFGILSKCSDADFAALLQSIQADLLSPTLSSLLCITSNTLGWPLFPDAWISLHLFHLGVLLQLLHYLADALTSRFSGPHFDVQLWAAWFQLGLEVRQASLLQLDTLTPARRTFVSDRVGNALPSVAALLDKLWQALSDVQKVQASSLLVGRLFILLSSENVAPELQRSALDLYFDMLIAAYNVEADFSEVERHSIDALYEVTNVSNDRGAQCMELVFEATSKRFKASKAGAEGLEFLEHMKTLFTLMASLLKLPDDPAFEDERASVALRLLAYIERTGHSATTRKAMHTRYIQFLVDLHMKAKNHVEAGITLLQQAKMLEWTDAPIEAYGRHPAEAERHRKERLVRAAIQSFCKAEDWERAIDRSDFLRYYYQYMVFDFRALTDLLTNQASYFGKIGSGGRFYSTYYRVCFYGNFEASLSQQCEFVYKGAKLEQIMDFTSRIRRRHPDAYYFMSTEKPSDDLLAKHEQVISIAALKVPQPTKRAEIQRDLEEKGSNAPAAVVRKGSDVALDSSFEQFQLLSSWMVSAGPAAKPVVAVPVHVARHQENDNVRVFEYSRPVKRAQTPNAVNEFQDLWLSKTYIVTADAFPSNRRRIPVSDKVEQLVKPIVSAIEAINKKSAELSVNTSNVYIATGPNIDVGPLSMNLNGTIDAAVNGGTKKYIDAFLTPAYLDPASIVVDEELADVSGTVDDRRRNQDALREALRNQVSVLREGLQVFGSKCDQQLKGLLAHLQTNFGQMVRLIGAE